MASTLITQGPRATVSPQPGMTIPVVALADSGGNLSGASTVTSLNAAGSGTGSVIDLGTVRVNNFAIVTSSAGATLGVVALQGSLDNTNWYTINSSAAVTASTTVAVVAATAPIPARYLRASLTVAVTGGTVTVVVGGM